MNGKKLIIFDYDGVIVDSIDIWIEVLEMVGSRYDAEHVIGRGELSKMKNITMNGIMDLAFVPDNNREKYLEDTFSELSDRALSMVLFKDIDNLLESLNAEDYIMCINTANNSKAILKKLEHTDLKKYISDVTGGDHCQVKSENINNLRKKFKVDAENTYMIGDSMNDITEGKKAGVNTIAVTYGWQSHDTLRKSSPDFICDSVKQLERLFIKS